MLGGSEVADYLLFTLKHMRKVAGSSNAPSSTAQERGAASGGKRGKPRRRKHDLGGHTLAAAITRPPKRSTAPPKKLSSISASKRQAPKTVGLYTPSREVYKPAPHPSASACMDAAGLSEFVRVGDYSDKMTIPAAVSLRDSLFTGEEQLIPRCCLLVSC